MNTGVKPYRPPFNYHLIMLPWQPGLTLPIAPREGLWVNIHAHTGSRWRGKWPVRLVLSLFHTFALLLQRPPVPLCAAQQLRAHAHSASVINGVSNLIALELTMSFLSLGFHLRFNPFELKEQCTAVSSHPNAENHTHISSVVVNKLILSWKFFEIVTQTMS